MNIEVNKEEYLRVLFDQSETATTTVKMTGQVDNPNKAMCVLFGYSKEEFKQLTFDQITIAEYLPLDRRYFNQLVKGDIDEYHMIKGYLHNSGIRFMADLYVYSVKNKNGEVVEVVAKVLPHNKVNKNWVRFFANHSKIIATIIGTISVGLIAIFFQKFFHIDILKAIP